MALGRGRRSRKWGADAYFTFPPPALSFFIGTWMDRSFSSVSSSSVAYTGIKREEEEASLPHFSLAFERKDEGGGKIYGKWERERSRAASSSSGERKTAFLPTNRILSLFFALIRESVASAALSRCYCWSAICTRASFLLSVRCDLPPPLPDGTMLHKGRLRAA